MGGRGSSSGGLEKDELHDGSGRSKGNWTKNGVGANIPPQGHLREAIGNQGRPISIDQATKGANPYYSAAHSEYSENCQRCVVAYELRRRGYDVVALPTYENDRMPYSTHGNGHWQQAFRQARNVRVGGRTAQQIRTNITNQMRAWGNGSRAVVRIKGHVFVAENVRGRIRYLEPQAGREYNASTIFNSVRNRGNISIVRTDNLRISDRARELVTTRRW